MAMFVLLVVVSHLELIMCGILFSSFGDKVEDTFSSALFYESHRGPDSSGVWTSDNGQIHIGHNRLSIIDLDERGNQPFFSDDGKHVITYNGEIYNFRELKKKYGLVTRTKCDTEVLLELFVMLGPSVLNELNGMFALVIYNTQTNDVFAARDRLGIKPLYSFSSGDKVSFSSEIGALLTLHGRPELDEIGVRQYLKARAFFRGHTIYEGIKIFPAGHYSLNGRLHKYWELPEEPITGKWQDDEIRDLLETAVEYRCIADVSLGSYLSGGLDSTIVAGLSHKPDTWTVGFEESNEFEWGRLAAETLGASHTEVLIDEQEFHSLLSELVKKRQEPLSVPNEVLLYKMTQSVRAKNVVVLSGEGADELFYGYDRIFRWAEQDDWSIEGFDQHYSYGRHQDNEILDYILEPIIHRPNSLDRVSAFFQIDHLHGLLRRLDNSTMMCSVEARVPFVDHRIIEYMYGAPSDYRMEGGVVKAPLKRIFGHILPKEIIERKKIGFPVPTDKLFKSDPESGMDAWLNTNMELLVGDEWNSVKEHFMSKLD
jgi:asparagine synthase (glutamine-hydrolysing)